MAKKREKSQELSRVEGASAELEALSEAALKAGAQELGAAEETLAAAREGTAMSAAALALGAADVTRGQDALFVSEIGRAHV